MMSLQIPGHRNSISCEQTKCDRELPWIAMLAMMEPNPKNFHPARFIDADLDRTKSIVNAASCAIETKLKQAVLRQVQWVVTDHTAMESVTKPIRNHLLFNRAVLANSTHLYLLTERACELAMSVGESTHAQKCKQLKKLQEGNRTSWSTIHFNGWWILWLCRWRCGLY